MNITIGSFERVKSKVDLLVAGMFEGDAKPPLVLKKLDGTAFQLVQSAIKNKRFSGKKDEQFHGYLDSLRSSNEILVLGLGKKENWKYEPARRATAGALNFANANKLKSIRILAECFLGGAVKLEDVAFLISQTIDLATYKFDRYQTKEELKPKRTVESVEILFSQLSKKKEMTQMIEEGRLIAGAVNFARDLINEPGNRLQPRQLADCARDLAKESGLRSEVLGIAELKKNNMNGILADAQGSHQSPQLIVLEYGVSHKRNGTICLVGKGVTFDSGGISLKPSGGMEKMKCDMSGAAAVLGTMKAISKLKLKIHVVAVIPCVENMPGGGAQRPGDIIKMHNGKSVEVINTDAEGRLILADALSYTKRFNPKSVIDLATLTGACSVDLGDRAIGLMGTDPKLVDQVRKAGERSGERCWELPLWDEYADLIKGHHSDLLNAGSGQAGTIVGGMFLKEFVPVKSWAHLDIASTAWTDANKPYHVKGGSGVGVRLLVELLKNWK